MRGAKSWCLEVNTDGFPAAGGCSDASAIRSGKLLPGPKLNTQSFAEPTLAGGPKSSYRRPKFATNRDVIRNVSSTNPKNCRLRYWRSRFGSTKLGAWRESVAVNVLG